MSRPSHPDCRATRVPIQDALKWLGIELKPSSNGQLRGCCPIHSGSNPREFVVTPSKGLYFCFGGCGGGDIIKLVASHRKIGTREAAAEIAAHFGKSSVTAAGNGTVPGKATVPQNEKAGFNPLTYLEATHEAVQALGVSADTFSHFGAGYAPKGSGLLGHSLPTTTAKYAHLAADPTRKAGELIAGRLTSELVGRQADVRTLSFRRSTPLRRSVNLSKSGLFFGLSLACGQRAVVERRDGRYAPSSFAFIWHA